MAVTRRVEALALLKAAAMCGAHELASALAPEVTLDASRADEPRVRLTGRGAVLEELERWWPGEGTLLDWREEAWAPGAAVTLERLGEDAHVARLRLYLRWEAGLICALWAYEARPRPGAAATPVGVPPEVLERIAPGGRREPLVHAGNSGAGLDRIVTRAGEPFIAKRVVAGGDWIARATHDPGREALLPYDRLPAAVAAVEPDPAGGWWVVSRDLTGTLVPATGRLTRADARRMLGAAAGLHAAFAGEPPLAVACSLEDRLALHSEAVARAERGNRDLVPKQLATGWEGFAQAAPPDVAAAVLAAVEDPAELAARLRAAGPSTLLHGDLRDDNVALAAGGAVLIDWGLAAWAPPAVELAWFLLHDAWRIDATREQLVEDFAAAEGELHDPAALDLGLLTGLVTYGWLLGHSACVHPDPAERRWAREELAWWSERARRALA